MLFNCSIVVLPLCLSVYDTFLRCLLEILFCILHEKHKIRVSYFSWYLLTFPCGVCNFFERSCYRKCSFYYFSQQMMRLSAQGGQTHRKRQFFQAFVFSFKPPQLTGMFSPRNSTQYRAIWDTWKIVSYFRSTATIRFYLK